MSADTEAVSGAAEIENVTLAQCNAPCTPPCEGEAVAHGLCNAHRMKKKRGLPIDTPARSYKADGAAKSHQLAFRVGDETWAGLERLAAKQGKTVYALVRSTVEELAKTARNSKTRPPEGS